MQFPANRSTCRFPSVAHQVGRCRHAVLCVCHQRLVGLVWAHWQVDGDIETTRRIRLNEAAVLVRMIIVCTVMACIFGKRVRGPTRISRLSVCVPKGKPRHVVAGTHRFGVEEDVGVGISDHNHLVREQPTGPVVGNRNRRRRWQCRRGLGRRWCQRRRQRRWSIWGRGRWRGSFWGRCRGRGSFWGRCRGRGSFWRRCRGRRNGRWFTNQTAWVVREPFLCHDEPMAGRRARFRLIVREVRIQVTVFPRCVSS